ncbi:MAG: helix-turn-helix domain-containing protein [Acidobacteriota bacterium]|nr:helix-turn-helix domain-containing protein [Acidobacteriota bacterium]
MSDTFQVRDERKPGHHWADNEVLDLYAARIGAYGYAIYMFMGRHASNVSGRCSKSQREIAATFGISHDTVQRYVTKLEGCGLIKRQVVPGKESVYVLLAVGKKKQSSESTDLPLTASSNRSEKSTPTACTPTPTACTPTPTAYSNKEVRLIQDSIKTKPSSAVALAAVDSRHGPVRDYIREQHSAALHMAIDVVPWDGRAAKALAKWLASNPKVTVEQVRTMVGYHYESSARLGMLFHQWVPELMRYWGNGPLNQYGTPLAEDKEWQREERMRQEARVGTNR